MSRYQVTRYQVLRKMGCDWFTASFIASGNGLRGYPEGTIVFMNVVIEYDPLEGEKDE